MVLRSPRRGSATRTRQGTPGAIAWRTPWWTPRIAFLSPAKNPSTVCVRRTVSVDAVAVADQAARVRVSERGVPDPFVGVEGRACGDVFEHDLAEGRAGTIRDDPRPYASAAFHCCEHHRRFAVDAARVESASLASTDAYPARCALIVDSFRGCGSDRVGVARVLGTDRAPRRRQHRDRGVSHRGGCFWHRRRRARCLGDEPRYVEARAEHGSLRRGSWPRTFARRSGLEPWRIQPLSLAREGAIP